VDFLVARDDLHRCRFLDSEPAELLPGQAQLQVASFGLTANNITYAMFGEAMSYWSFFPAEEGWGRVPVWGFAEVTATQQPELEVGTRVYGYLPPSSEFILEAARVDARGFIDASPHRARLPPAYNSYARTDADPIYDDAHEDEQMLLRPLFFTSYLIDDFLDDCATFGAGTVVLSSASSKTASALAFLLSRREGVEVVGLTSSRSGDFARRLGVYDAVIPYEEISELPRERSVYVDMAGDAAVRDAVHGHYGEELAHSAVVGATHHDRMGELPDGLPGPRPMFFFAPDRVTKRSADWGREGLEQRLADAWRPYLEWTGTWLEVLHGEGSDAVEGAYLDLLDGRIDPAKAHVLSLPR
jgi:NADPH:quinone reductase-like Zn-dependent oxidoreductase